MNYRHAFHAGNFADLAKHAILTLILRELTVSRDPLTVIDTHAGAGLYDLEGELARKTGEAGVDRLMDAKGAPPEFEALKAAVRRANAPGSRRFYPGSPLLIAQALRPRDAYLACELRPDDFAALKSALPREAGAQALAADGWTVLAERAPAAPARLLVLIDPPFERADDYAQAVAAAGAVLRRNRGATIVIWLPIKDLNGFDDFLGRLEDAVGRAPVLVAQTRLRPLTDPMKLNGCALAIVNPPADLRAPALAVVDWTARTLGEARGEGRVSVLGGG